MPLVAGRGLGLLLWNGGGPPFMRPGRWCHAIPRLKSLEAGGIGPNVGSLCGGEKRKPPYEGLFQLQ